MLRVFFICLYFISYPLHSATDNPLMRLHGSNTIGAELAPALVKNWLTKEGYYDIDLVTVAPEYIEMHATDGSGQRQSVEIQSHGSGTGFTSLAQSKADIAMSSRTINADELDMLANFGDFTSHKIEHIIGLDGIAVIVNEKNTIRMLQKSTVAKIFTGEIRDWGQIDSTMQGTINVYARDNKSGTYDTFKSLVLGKDTLIASAKRYESSTQLADDVANDASAIGFIGLPYVRNTRALSIAETGSLARYPKVFDVATEDYALSRRLYMYVPSTSQNKFVASFIRFVRSGLGQVLVENNGFVSQTIMAQAVELDKALPSEYLKFTEDSERLSMNIRFSRGSIKIDTKAHYDLDRLVEFMKVDVNRDRKILLFGFSDETRSLQEYGEDLATHRVDRVADLLISKGIDPVRVRAYGSTNPVASNDDVSGRLKNRRVEIWIQ